MYGQSVHQKTVRSMTMKDNSGTLPINLYAPESLTVHPLDFTVLSEAASVPVRHRETTQTLYKLVFLSFLAFFICHIYKILQRKMEII